MKTTDRVEWAVVSSLATRAEHEVVRHLIAAAEAIDEVDAGSRPVEEHCRSMFVLRNIQLES